MRQCADLHKNVVFPGFSTFLQLITYNMTLT
jgi:hypothetical protein